MTTVDIFLLVGGVIVGAVVGYLLARVKQERISAELDLLREQLKEVGTLRDQLREAEAERTKAVAILDEVRNANEEKLRQKEIELDRILAEKQVAFDAQKQLLADAEKVLADKFGMVSAESLRAATADFLKLANENFEKANETARGDLKSRQESIDEMLKPLRETLDKMDRQDKEIDRGIRDLQEEARNLANALRKPNTRGAWGEMQLQVILENAGLIQGEHFILQDSTEGDEGRLRTDVVIRLPKDRLLIIDSKAPLETFWDGMNCADEVVRSAKFMLHARLVKDHVKKLSSKSYWARYQGTPDCVVMFIPTEGAYQAAIEADPTLITEAHSARVYLANPMTLVSMIHIAAHVLNEERLRANALEVREAGATLYERLKVFASHLNGVGRHLGQSVDLYNKAVASLDGRVLPQARRMHALGAGKGDPIETPLLIDTSPRALASPEAQEVAED